MGASRRANFVLNAWRFLELGARDVVCRIRTTPCDECSQPIHWWNRRVWVVNGERCAHLQCWNGQLFLKAYVQRMAEEIRHSAQRRAQSSDNDCAYPELRELRSSARAIRERVERVEAQLQQAEELAAKMRGGVRNNGKLPNRSGGLGTLGPGSGALRDG